MKIRLFSDLHNEIRRMGKNKDYEIKSLPSDWETVLVLAGDIDTKFRIKEYAERYANEFRAVVYVLGNHDYYGKALGKEIQAESTIPNVHLLHNSEVTIEGTRFVGGTLWTNFFNGNHIIMNRFAGMMLDAKKITRKTSTATGVNYSKIRADDILAEHVKTLAYFKKVLENQNRQTVVVSHHSPSYKNESPRFTGSLSSDFYHSSLEELAFKADLWLFGHTHYNVDHKPYDMTRMKTNQSGYEGYETVENFNETEVIEI